ncbi:MAG TPA: methyltransferase [Opitutaceae bacterium]|nr:methyltransferase [Opitutaceae bacterium]
MNPSHYALALAPGLATWLVPLALRYRRGAWSVAGAAVTLVLLLAAWLGTGRGAFGPEDFAVLGRPALLFLLPGILTCAVAYRDRRPATLATLFSLVALAAAAFGAGWASWLAFAVFAAFAALRAFVPPPPTVDERDATAARNRTRRARSIVRKLVREGRFHWIPVYFLLRLSQLGREGIERSGSYRFADHIYRNVPSGRGVLGRFIDARLLALPASRAFRQRYKRAQAALRASLEAHPGDEPLNVLAIPCGIPRDLAELAATLRREDPALLARVHYHGMDIDPELLQLAEEFTRGCGVARRDFLAGNALAAADYPKRGMHAVVSTGLGEFLDDADLLAFYRNVHAALRPGGIFYTSATRRDARSEAFLNAFELHARYRTADEMARILGRMPWSRVTLTPDETGLQTFVVAVK